MTREYHNNQATIREIDRRIDALRAYSDQKPEEVYRQIEILQSEKSHPLRQIRQERIITIINE